MLDLATDSRMVPLATAPEGGDAFGDRVDVVLEMRGHGIEEQVELVEILPFYVPVRPFDLAVRIDTVGQAEIQKGDDRLAVFVGDADAAGIGADGCGCCFCHWKTSSGGVVLGMRCSGGRKGYGFLRRGGDGMKRS